MKKSLSILYCVLAGLQTAQALDVGFKIPADAPNSQYDRDFLQMPFRRDPNKRTDDLISFRWVFGETNRGAEAGFPLSACEFSKASIHEAALVELLEKNPEGDDRHFLLEVRDFPQSFVSSLPKCEFLARLKRFLRKMTSDSSCDLRAAPTCPGYTASTQK